MTVARDLEAAAQPEAGQSIGAYRIESLLGEGGMARVYKAVGVVDAQRVAIKLMKADVAVDPLFRRRFDREVSLAASIAHPHVIRVLHFGRHEGVPYMAQEYIPGGSLEDRIEREGPLKIDDSVALCLQIAAGLEAVHGLGLIHRDLKPANVLLDDEGRAKITDFGLAKDPDATALTRPGQAVGSMDYMSPEQIQSADISTSADVYALGCLMYACVLGKPPFADRQGVEILWAHLKEAPTNPCTLRSDLPAGVGRAILSALEKEPANRPPSAAAFAQMIEVAAGPGPGPPGC